MAFPTVEGTPGALTDAVNATAHVVPYPTGVSGGIQAGDLLLVVGAIDEVATTTISNWNGFTQLNWGDVPTLTAAGGVAYKWAAGGETGTITFTSSVSERAVFRMYCIRGGDTGKNPEFTVATGNSTNPNPPSLTPTWSGSVQTLWFVIAVVDATVPTAAPTNYTNLETQIGTSTAAIGVARRNLIAATEDPGVFTMVTDQWRALTVGVAPIVSTTTIVAPACSSTANTLNHLETVKSLPPAASTTASTTTATITKSIIIVVNNTLVPSTILLPSLILFPNQSLATARSSGATLLFTTAAVTVPPALATANTTTHSPSFRVTTTVGAATASSVGPTTTTPNVVTIIVDFARAPSTNLFPSLTLYPGTGPAATASGPTPILNISNANSLFITPTSAVATANTTTTSLTDTVLPPAALATASTTTHISIVRITTTVAAATASASAPVILAGASTNVTTTAASATANTTTHIFLRRYFPSAGLATASSIAPAISTGGTWTPHIINRVTIIEPTEQVVLVGYQSSNINEYSTTTTVVGSVKQASILGYKSANVNDYATKTAVVAIFNNVSFTDLETEVTIIP